VREFSHVLREQRDTGFPGPPLCIAYGCGNANAIADNAVYGLKLQLRLDTDRGHVA